MAELEYAIKLANIILDQPSRDPDDDLSVISRQFLRAREICDLVMENDRLKADARKANSQAAKCWFKEEAGETVATIYGEISADHRKRLLELLNEIEKS